MQARPDISHSWDIWDCPLLKKTLSNQRIPCDSKGFTRTPSVEGGQNLNLGPKLVGVRAERTEG